MRFDHDVATKLAAPAKYHRYVIFRLYRDTVFFCAFVFALLDRGQCDTSSVLVQGTGGAQCLPQAGRSGSVLTAGVGIKGTISRPRRGGAVPPEAEDKLALQQVRSQLGPKFPHVPYSGVPGSGSVRIQALT